MRAYIRKTPENVRLGESKGSLLVPHLAHTLLAVFFYTDGQLRKAANHVLLIGSDGSRAATVNEVAFSPLLDGLAADFRAKGITTTHLSLPYSILVGKKATGHPVSVNRRFLIYSLAHFLAKRLDRLRSRTTYTDQWLIRFWERVLTESQAKAVIAIGSPPALSSATRRLGLDHYEMQHGYGWDTKTFELAKISAWYATEGVASPGWFLAYDRSSADYVRALNRPGLRVAQVVSPELSDGGNLSRHQVETEVSNPDKRTVVFAAQWVVGSDARIESTVFGKSVVPHALTEAMRNDEEIHWLVRLHPLHITGPRKRRILARLKRDLDGVNNVEWENSTRLPFNNVVTASKGLLTAGSAGAAYQAAALGVPSLICGYDYGPDSGEKLAIAPSLVDAGMASYGSWDSASILDWARNTTMREPFRLHSSITPSVSQFVIRHSSIL